MTWRLLRPAIDIVAEGNDCRRSIRLRVLLPLPKGGRSARQIGNCVNKRHHFTSITSTSAARTCRRMSAAMSGNGEPKDGNSLSVDQNNRLETGQGAKKEQRSTKTERTDTLDTPRKAA
jgi:hypothetical protein